MALHGHAWQSATELSCQDFAWSYLPICQIATPWCHRFAIAVDRQLAQIQRTKQTHTHARVRALINVGRSYPGPYGPRLGKKYSHGINAKDTFFSQRKRKVGGEGKEGEGIGYRKGEREREIGSDVYITAEGVSIPRTLISQIDAFGG